MYTTWIKIYKQETANNFPSSITNIKTNSIKVIQVSTAANVSSESVKTFSFPVDFVPLGFIGCAADVVKNNYSSSSYVMSPSEGYITSFSYVDNKFIAIITRVYTSTQGTTTHFCFASMSLGTNDNTNVAEKFNVSITSTEVTISPSSSRNNVFLFREIRLMDIGMLFIGLKFSYIPTNHYIRTNLCSEFQKN